jgi:hypothetical protein
MACFTKRGPAESDTENQVPTAAAEVRPKKYLRVSFFFINTKRSGVGVEVTLDFPRCNSSEEFLVRRRMHFARHRLGLAELWA